MPVGARQRGSLFALVVVVLQLLAVRSLATTNCSSNATSWFADHTPGRARATTVVEKAGHPTEFRDLFFSVNRFSILQEVTAGNEDTGDVGDAVDEDGHAGSSSACRRSSTNADSYPNALGVHVPIDCLPVVSAAAFLSNAKVKWIPGVSLWVDFPPSGKIEHLGHWMEIAAEVRAYVLGMSQEEREEIKHVLLYPLFKKDIAGAPWIVDLLSVALEGVPSFKLWFFPDLSKNLDHWVGIERAVRFGGWSGEGDRDGRLTTAWRTTTASPAVKELREALWRTYGIDVGVRVESSGSKLAPRDMTLILPVDEAGVSNSREVLEVLHRHKSKLQAYELYVRPYSPTLGTPLNSLVKRMAQTQVLVARHGPLLGLAALLPPGALVVELLPHRYDGIDTFDLFHTMSTWLGDVRHVTLAMNSTDSVEYLQEEDRGRYDEWTGGECYGDDCREAMEFSGLVVDTRGLDRLLDDVIAVDTSALLSRYAHPQRAPRVQTHAGIWYDNQ